MTTALKPAAPPLEQPVVPPAAPPAAPPAGPTGATTGGLSSAEAARRLAADGPNLLPGSAPKPTWALVLGVLTEPMFGMLLAAGGIYLALGDRAEASFLLGFVFVVIGITLVQERRTQRALESLRDLSAPRAQVLRDGQPQRMAGRDVVRGDWLLLHEGDRVAADAVLRQGDLSVDESLLTGESVPVDKATGAEGDGAAVFASTVVTRGTATAEVTATAAGTAVGRIGQSLADTREPDSPLQTASHRLVRVVGAVAVALALLQVLLAWWWDGHDLLPSLLSGIALAMAILPEEIPVIMTVFLALGAWRIAQQQVLTRRVSAVEALGAVTVLAVDKTGTLTQNRMAVAEWVAPDDGRWALGDAAPPTGGALPAGATVSATTPPGVLPSSRPNALPDALHPLVETALLATPPDAFDPMDLAIQAFGAQALAGTEHHSEPLGADFDYPLSGELLAVTRGYADPKGGSRLATKGAPEAVADLCHLDDAARARVRAQVQAMAVRGLRVLGVARGSWQAPTGAAPLATAHDHDFEFLGLVGLADPPRPDVPPAIALCRAAGVRVVMMTGDHPDTARAIAAQVGLTDRPHVLTGAEIESFDDATLTTRLRDVDICARLQPAHKLRLVNLLRADGQVVAMTGDGVNDAPALKAADIGIAMGQRGTDVAREAAALVLLDDSFARIVAAIAQGRRIFDNLCRAARFTFAVHMPIVGLALVPPLLHWPLMLLPVQIVLLELLIDPACSVVFEAEPAAADLMTRPPRGRGASPFAAANLWGGVAQGLGLAAVLLVGHGLLAGSGMPAAQASGAVFAALVLDVMLLVLANRAGPVWPWQQRAAVARNPWLPRMALGMALLLALVFALPPLRGLMGLAWPTAHSALATGALVAAGGLWLLALRLAMPWFQRSPDAPAVQAG